jgi:large subunit ribosomal protein L19
MSQQLIQAAEERSLKKDIPHFEIGDTVTVSVRIVEGDKERLQPYNGVVIARRGSGVRETFCVRRIVNNEGVERIFPLHSPKVAGIEVHRSGKARRAKLYYLRDRIGKARRLRERKSRRRIGEQGTNEDVTDQAERRSEKKVAEPVGASA